MEKGEFILELSSKTHLLYCLLVFLNVETVVSMCYCFMSMVNSNDHIEMVS